MPQKCSHRTMCVSPKALATIRIIRSSQREFSSMQIPLRHEGLYRALASPDFLPSREFGRPQLVPREIALMEAQKIRFGHLPAPALTKSNPVMFD